MADMPAYDPDTAPGYDSFADELAGNVYPTRNPADPPRGLYGVAHKQLFGLAEGGKAELVRNIGSIVTMVREIAGQIEGFGVEPFAGYARQASGVVSDIHDKLAEKSVEALIDDGRALVREQPEIAIAAAIITGFIGARLLKARS
ncbi:MAG: hypothetical protein H7267_05155 [Sandarakinorhabdus sp.]|nr:hypothetical protein [Sandarakinorhabdus sp.]